MSLDRPLAPDPYQLLPVVPTFELTSTDLIDGEAVPTAHAADGANVSPALSWSGFPDGTRSFAVTCFDPDAPTPSGFWHWGLAGLPVTATEIRTGTGDPAGALLPAGAFQIRNDGGSRGYSGPMPPAGDREHRYFFVVHAVDVDQLEIDDSVSNAVLSFNLVFHTLARAQLVATYRIAAADM